MLVTAGAAFIDQFVVFHVGVAALLARHRASPSLVGAALAGAISSKWSAAPAVRLTSRSTHTGPRAASAFVQASAAPNRNSSGRVVGMVYSFIDITERIQADQEREQLRIERDGTATIETRLKPEPC